MRTAKLSGLIAVIFFMLVVGQAQATCVYTAGDGSSTEAADEVTAISVSSSGAMSTAGSYGAGDNARKVTVSPSGSYLYVAASDGVHAYTITSSTCVLSELSGSPYGKESRAVTVNPAGTYLFSVEPSTFITKTSSRRTTTFKTETAPSLKTYSIGSTGGLSTVHTSRPSGLSETDDSSYFDVSPVDLEVTPSGGNIYLSDWLNDRIHAGTVSSSGVTSTSPHRTYGECPLGLVSDSDDHLFSAHYCYDSDFYSFIGAFDLTTSTGSLLEWTDSPFDSVNLGPVDLAMVDEMLYEAEYGSDTIVQQATSSTGLITVAAATTSGTDPSGLDVNSTGSQLYVSLQGSSELERFMINASSATITSTGAIAVGATPRSVAVQP